MKHRIAHDRLAWTIAAATLAIAGWVGAVPAVASGGSTCISASVPEAFVLPDGSEYDAGTLKLCVERRHSPVSHMHEASVDGMTVGLHIGRTNQSEAPATVGSYVMFGRGKDGMLRLLGYARPGIDHMEVFSLRRAVHITADPQLEDRVREEPILITALSL